MAKTSIVAAFVVATASAVPISLASDPNNKGHKQPSESAFAPKCIEPPAKLNPTKCESARVQSPADVSANYHGSKTPSVANVNFPFKDAGMRQVNTHFHLGAEHRSDGEYFIDADDVYMNDFTFDEDYTIPQTGRMCEKLTDEDLVGPKRTYAWEYCEHVKVGLTYEIHWPFSTNGADEKDGKPQLTDGLGGVFCQGYFPTIGVQGQVYQIVNPKNGTTAFDNDNLLYGMNTNITVDADIASYLGSTTGPGYNNSWCSPYAPISWQVDRKCRKVSAKSFDNMCRMMKEDHGMEGVHPHGSRLLVDGAYVTDGNAPLSLFVSRE